MMPERVSHALRWFPFSIVVKLPFKLDTNEGDTCTKHRNESTQSFLSSVHPRSVAIRNSMFDGQ